jgi:hypothetical protein
MQPLADASATGRVTGSAAMLRLRHRVDADVQLAADVLPGVAALGGAWPASASAVSAPAGGPSAGQRTGRRPIGRAAHQQAAHRGQRTSRQRTGGQRTGGQRTGRWRIGEQLRSAAVDGSRGGPGQAVGAGAGPPGLPVSPVGKYRRSPYC